MGEEAGYTQLVMTSYKLILNVVLVNRDRGRKSRVQRGDDATIRQA